MKLEAVAVPLEILAKRKWAPAVIRVLDQADGALRFGQLQARIGRISEQSLNQTLRGLLRDGLVRREAYGEIPPRVEYSITPLGRSFCHALLPVFRWEEEHAADVIVARQRFDEQHAPQEST